MTDEEQMDDYIERALQLLTERTKKPCVNFRLTDSEPDIFSGKIGGTPYLPHDAYPPKNKDGKEMHLLCQADCAALAELPDFPHEGMLQFWLEPRHPYDDFRITYHKTVDRTVTEAEVQAKITPMTDEEKDSFFVVNGGYGMDMTNGYSVMSRSDKRIGNLICQCVTEVSDGTFIDRFGDDFSALFYDDLPRGSGHRFGGYHYDVQAWFSGRYDENWISDLGTEDETLLLFQLEYEHRCGKNWREGAKVILGDCGVINIGTVQPLRGSVTATCGAGASKPDDAVREVCEALSGKDSSGTV